MTESRAEIIAAATNEAISWDDRKSLAEAYQSAGGKLPDLSESTYDGLLAVARWGAARLAEWMSEEEEQPGTT